MRRKFHDIELPDKHLSLGIVGAGDIVGKVHLPVLMAIKNVFVTWITDLDANKAKALARAFGVDSCKLPNDLTMLPTSDVVLLAIPFGARDPYYKALRKRQSALYVEKPFSRKVEHHQRICSWFPDYGITSGLHKRSYAPTQLMKEVIDTKMYGQLQSVRFGLGGVGLTRSGSYSSDIGLAGGGALFDNGIYGIDAILFCTRTAALRIKSAKMIMDGGFDLHTVADFVITTNKGESIDCQLTVSCLEDTIDCLEFRFEHAIVSYSLFSGEGLYVRPLLGRERYRMFPDNPLYPVTAYETYYEFWSRFLSGVYSQKADWTCASQSILTTELIERLYEVGSGFKAVKERAL